MSENTKFKLDEGTIVKIFEGGLKPDCFTGKAKLVDFISQHFAKAADDPHGPTYSFELWNVVLMDGDREGEIVKRHVCADAGIQGQAIGTEKAELINMTENFGLTPGMIVTLYVGGLISPDGQKAKLLNRITEKEPIKLKDGTVKHFEHWWLQILETGEFTDDDVCLEYQFMELQQAEAEFIELDRQKAEIKKFYENYDASVERLVALGGVGHHFQDGEGVVYQTDDAKGTYVYYKTHEVKRTRRLSHEEKAGSLSLTDAKELGYTVEGKTK